MAQRQRQGNAGSGQFGDTTRTKIFVGGLAWETQRDTMRCYFEQFGEILEAVVITDKATGRSKGYGFVTFRDEDSAARACENSSPVIDGRRANCNLASVGARPSRPISPRHGGRYRMTTGSAGAPPFHTVGPSYPQQPRYAFHQAFPYQTYGFTGYSQEGMYPMTYYNPHGAQQQLSHFYPGLGLVPNPAILPYYMQQAQTNMQYQQMVQYPQYMQRYPTPILSLPTNLPPNTAGGVPVNAGPAASSSSSQQAGSGNAEQNFPSA